MLFIWSAANHYEKPMSQPIKPLKTVFIIATGVPGDKAADWIAPAADGRLLSRDLTRLIREVTREHA